MTIEQQLESLKLLFSQIERAEKEGLILTIGDMNIDLNKMEEPTYYLKKLAMEYQLMIGECGLEILDFGYTWSRTYQNGNILKSGVDHALTNKPESINNHCMKLIDYSDHNMICVDLNVRIPKSKENYITARDFRKLRSNPQFILNKLANIKWESLWEYGRRRQHGKVLDCGN